MRTTATLGCLLITTVSALAESTAPPPPAPPGLEVAPEPDRLMFQIGVGYLNGGSVYVEDAEIDTDGGPVGSIAIDSLVNARLSVGLFAVAARTDVLDTTAQIATAGATIKSRFGAPNGTQLRVGVAFGYQRITIEDAEEMEPIQGFDIAPIVEVAFPSNGSMSLVLQASALSQPVGGNGDVEVTFAPLEIH